MALNPSAEWPSQTQAPNAAYIYGAAQNITVPGDNTGTPFVANMVNDWFGFFQGILDTAGIVPSGVPDTVVTSQYRDALDFIVATAIDSNVPAATETVAGKAEIATQAETDAGLDDERFITPLKFKTAIGSGLITDTWIVFTVSGGVPSTSWSSNASVVRDASGKYTVTFGTPMSSLEYATDILVGSEGASERSVCYDDTTKTVNGFSFLVSGVSDGSAQDPSIVDIKVSREV